MTGQSRLSLRAARDYYYYLSFSPSLPRSVHGALARTMYIYILYARGTYLFSGRGRWGGPDMYLYMCFDSLLFPFARVNSARRGALIRHANERLHVQPIRAPLLIRPARLNACNSLPTFFPLSRAKGPSVHVYILRLAPFTHTSPCRPSFYFRENNRWTPGKI